jgi:transaldolase
MSRFGVNTSEHLLYCFQLEADLVTAPAKILEDWAKAGFPTPDNSFAFKTSKQPIPYERLDLNQESESFDIRRELTVKDIEKFSADYLATLSGAQ